MNILNLYRKSQNRKEVVRLERQTELLTKKDIGYWRDAWQRAINTTNPDRRWLLSVYTDVAIDAHVSGCIEQRTGMVKKANYYLIDTDGKTNEKATALILTDWFQQFINLVLESRYYGFSLCEFGNVTEQNGQLSFEYCRLVNRRHVHPETGTITVHESDNAENGISYLSEPLAGWCIPIGEPNDLGLLLKVAPSAISKKNMLAFWDGFGEIFGMPIRIARTTSNDPSERSRLMRVLKEMGSAFSGVFSEGTDIEIKESTRGDAFNVFDRRIDRANSEISKCILGQTMTIDNGASLSQSEVHLEVLQNLISADRQMVTTIVNQKLLPFMQKHGFAVDGVRFVWDETEQYTPQDMRTVEQMLINGGYEIDPQYFVDKYEIPVTGRRSPLEMKVNAFFA